MSYIGGISMGSRKDALLKGLKVYTSDKACVHCGSFEKYVSNYSCVDCQKKKLYNDDLMKPYRTAEKQKEKLKNWRKNNYDKYQQQWLDPDKKPQRNARAAKRRASKRNQTPVDSDLDLIRKIYEDCKQISDSTGVLHEVDHIIPIAKGGLHHQDNLQIITKTENRQKGSRLDHENRSYNGHSLRSPKRLSNFS